LLFGPALVNQPTPAIVAQDAVRRLPRAVLLLFCLAYVLPGFVGREPWKNADITGFGHMFELAHGHASWLSPTLLGRPPEFDALLPYWLGAWAIQIAPAWVPADLAARIPFIALLALTLAATWYGVYYLARSPQAQPVPFAFGGEAPPIDYARAMADAGLLALVACLGLAQFSHETTPSLAQLAFTAMAFYGLAALPFRRWSATAGLLSGTLGLVLSGGPAIAVLFGIGGIVVALLDREEDGDTRQMTPAAQAGRIAAIVVICAAIAMWLHVWQWRVNFAVSSHEWRPELRLILWFAWPAWPLALWTLWRWRGQRTSRHVTLPLWFVLVAVGTMVSTPTSDRSLLLALPALAALAAFALPTFSRSASALIDWFTLLFFTICAIAIWVIWLSLQTGFPSKPAANIARLAPGFVPSFSIFAFAAALAGTLAWLWLVRWRTGRNRQVIWKSLVLPASGTALCWLLLMTLGLPVLDYARSYAPLVRNVRKFANAPGCVQELGLSRAQIAAFMYHGAMDLRSARDAESCPWLLVAAPLQPAANVALDMKRWRLVASVRRPSDNNENVLLYRRATAR
jgi:4-amino-4-deoxy-L-arabinose transferase-like glycosyltransferase